jgi:hypothetical protein
MYERTIKPSTNTEFAIGTKVKIVNSGHCYSGYKDMATYMGLNLRFPLNPFRNGDVGHVIAIAQHESSGYGDVIAVRIGSKGNSNGPIGLMNPQGVIVVKPVILEPTVAELKVELAMVKAKLWDAEQKLKKMVDIATE